MYKRVARFLRWHNLIAKALNPLVLLVTGIWLITSIEFQPVVKVEWEPVTAFLGLLSSLAWLEVNSASDVEADRKVEADRTLFKNFLEVLPSNGTIIGFLRNYFTGDSYSFDFILRLQNFVENWNTAERTFHTAELERLKVKLIKAMDELLIYGSTRMSPVNNQVVRIHYDVENPQYDETARRISELAVEIVSTHQGLIQKGKSLLDV